MTPSDANARINELFDDRPESPDELEERLSLAGFDAARELVLERLLTCGAPPRDSDLLVAILKILGIDTKMADALAGLLLDTAAPRSGRAFALALLSSADPARASTIARQLSVDDLLALNEAQLLTVIARMPAAPGPAAQEICRKLERQPPASRIARLEQLESVRAALRVPAAILYAELLVRPELQLADRALDLILAEGGQGAALYLEHVMQRSPEAVQNAQLWAALARAAEHPDRPPLHDLEGFAWLSDERSDGEAAAVLALESSIDGSYTIVAVRWLEDGPIRAAMIVPLSSRRDIRTLLGAPSPFLYSPASLAEAGARVGLAAARTRQAPEKLSVDACAAACYFDLAKRAASTSGSSELN